MKQEKGFTLIEVAIVLVIGGILLASASALLLNYMKKVQFSTTERRLEAVDEALALFLSLNGRYPCPADPAALIDDPGGNFGVEVATCNLAANAPNGRGGRIVRIGDVPVRTLNLPDDFIGDSWGGRFTYAITEALADPAGTYNRDEGAIFIRDSNNNEVAVIPGSVPPQGGIAHYAIVSHGVNNSGATALAGGGATPCTAGTQEEENCNGDAIFRSTMLLATANNASLNDDLVLFKATSPLDSRMIPSGAVMAFSLSACPEGWISFASAQGRMVMGAGGVYSVGDTGGAAEVTLTNPQAGFSTRLIANPANGPVPMAQVIPTEDHENLPPYISLLYCEKT